MNNLIKIWFRGVIKILLFSLLCLIIISPVLIFRYFNQPAVLLVYAPIFILLLPLAAGSGD